MTELEQLLTQAGYRPSSHGKRWHCKGCPTDKPASVSVHDDLYYCHRCGTGGNVITLKKELGIRSVYKPKTADEVLDDQKVRLIFETADRIMRACKDEHLKRFKFASTQAFYFNKIGLYQCQKDGQVDNEILEKAYYYTQLEQVLEWELNWIEKQKPEDFIDLAIDQINWMESYDPNNAR